MDREFDTFGQQDESRNFGSENTHSKEFKGFYRGTVVDTKDPEKLGRVKIRVPEVYGDGKAEYWAWTGGQPSGPDFGDFFPLKKGSPLWVTFEKGNPRFPIALGGHWHKGEDKKSNAPEEARLDDPQNRVRKTDKWVMEMHDGEDYLKFKSRTNDNNFFSLSGDGKFDLQTTEKLNYKTKDFDIEATGQGEWKLGGATIKFNGSSLEIGVGGKKIEISGAGVSIEGKLFLPHQHTGVDPGGGTSGGVA